MSRGGRSGGLDGVLIVAKPSGPTSHDVVGLVRRLSSTRRVGHGGTLDPFAAGVLPVFLGRATRLVEYHLGVDEALPGDDLLRGAVDDGRHRRRADARRRPAGHPRRRDRGPGRLHRPDQPGPARLQRGPDRGTAGVPARALRAARRARPARGHDPRPRPRRLGRRRPGAAGGGRRRQLLGRDVHPGARAGPWRAPRHRRLPRGARAHGVRRLPARGRDAARRPARPRG